MDGAGALPPAVADQTSSTNISTATTSPTDSTTSTTTNLLTNPISSDTIRSHTPPPSFPPLPQWARRLTPIWSFLAGPNPPEMTAISPFFPRIQSWPSRTIHRLLPRKRYRRLAQFIFWVVWAVVFFSLVHWSRFETRVGEFSAHSDGGGVLQVDCVAAYWARNNLCGLNGQLCRPFEREKPIAFRCPSGCRTVKLLNPRAVGNESMVFMPYVVGGPGGGSGDGIAYNAPYRADSFICQAAIHAGVVSHRFGGCGLLRQTGASPSQGYSSSYRNGIQSGKFPASFPSSYVFVEPSPGTTMAGCLDLRWHILPISAIFTFLQALIATTAAALAGPVLTAVFWHVGLVSEPPLSSADNGGGEAGYELISLVLSRFLPAAFVLYVVYLYILGPTWANNCRPRGIVVTGTADEEGGGPVYLPTNSHDRSPHRKLKWRVKPPFPIPPSLSLERAFLFLLGLWITALTNITLDPLIPLARLTGHDIATQPGAKAALAVIIAILIVITIGQAYYLRKEGRLPRYLAFYICIGIVLLILALSWRENGELNLRIHHYILGLLLLPGTKIGNRPSILYQGLLLGLVINGIARWGFAAILETGGGLRGDAVLGRGGLPKLLPPALPLGSAASDSGGNVTIRWEWPRPEDNVLFDGKTGKVIEGQREWDAVSVLVNDVERWRAEIPQSFPEDAGPGVAFKGNFTWPRRKLEDGTWETVFVRIGYMSDQRQNGDYSRAGVVLPEWPGKGAVDVGSGDDPGIEDGWIPPKNGRT